MSNLLLAPLGKKVEYKNNYDTTLLFAVERCTKRKELGINNDDLPFVGMDIWNAYEVSWLNKNGKPVVVILEINYDCNSKFIVESKSLKLYFNSFNNTKFNSIDEVINTISNDLERILFSKIYVGIVNMQDNMLINNINARLIDDIDICIDKFELNPSILSINKSLQVEEQLCSNLLKSNCLITSQPDWATVFIEYNGHKIDEESLLRYIIGFRDHNEFHEQCVERIFMDINKICTPNWLTIYARFTRRGGIDINPVRSNNPNFVKPLNHRLARQ